jgi:hypothetical protein
VPDDVRLQAQTSLWLSGRSIAHVVALSGAHLNVYTILADPEALAYVVAHNFSFFVRETQYLWAFASDPFGFGWDLFGTAEFRPEIGLLEPKTVWYTQVAALVIGHVAGLVLAHDKAVELFDSPRKAAISQYAMLALMVVYTCGGLWLLSR